MFVVFDFDGTLADTYPVFRAAFDDAASAMNTCRYRRSEEQHIRSLEAGEVLRFHGVSPADIPAFIDALREGMETRREMVSMFPGMSHLLNELRKGGHKLGLVSSNSVGLIGHTLMADISLFSFLMFDIPLREKVVALRHAADSCSPHESMCYIGDEIRDFTSSQIALVSFGGVAWGYNTEASLRKAGCNTIFHKPSDIADYVGQSR